MSTTALVVVVLLAVIAVAAIGALVSLRKRRTTNLRAQFGEPEYARALEATGSRRDAEARLDARKQRVEGFHIRPLAPADQARFTDSWRQNPVAVRGRPRRRGHGSGPAAWAM